MSQALTSLGIQAALQACAPKCLKHGQGGDEGHDSKWRPGTVLFSDCQQGEQLALTLLRCRADLDIATHALLPTRYQIVAVVELIIWMPENC